MREWQTKVQLTPSEKKIDYGSKILLLGSCFSDEMGKKLKKLKFHSKANPAGISFNPISIFKQFENRKKLENRIIERDGLYFHYDYHSIIIGSSPEELSDLIEIQQQKIDDYLKETNWLIITFGTSIVHETADGEIVANCHKQPSSLFKKRFLSVEEIVSRFHDFYKKMPDEVQILLNVSPIRHTREGLENNQLSKSILRVACSEISDNYLNVSYLPTYEIFLDELRDYRFYKRDMIHPSEDAVDYVFDLFSKNFMTDATLLELNRVKKLFLEINHTPLNKGSLSYTKFKENLVKKLEESIHDFSREIEKLKVS